LYRPTGSANPPKTAASAQGLDARDEIAIWKDIIALGLHYDHEIALSFHIEQHLSRAFSFKKQFV
jgi:hypothetical protein